MSLNPQNCMPGQEQHEYFYGPKRPGKPAPKHCQYDYRHHDGELFSCIAPTLEAARARKQDWLNLNVARENKTI